jgi:serine/threonine protein kinase
MAIADIHPSAAELEAFTLGTLDNASHAAVEGHVADCPPCQERAAGTAGDTFVELLRSAHARIARQSDTMAEAAAQAQTPDAAEAVTLTSPASADSADAETVDFVPQELARHERYRVVRLLGKGGMGSVYEAEHRVMRRAVALKVINRAYTARRDAVERFRREVRAAARLAHPNIVTTYDAEDAGDTYFLVMEYVEGVSLARLVKERGPLPVAEACAYVRQAALGLQHAHERGIVHRDVKPHNLIRCTDGVVKVLDFGLAALTAERGGGLTEENAVMGTPDFMAPEQAEDARDTDIRADVYSLGCTLYFLLTGQVPYPVSTALRKILAHREQPVPSIRRARPEAPPELARVLTHMLAKKPEDRYLTPGEVAVALEPFASAKRTKEPKSKLGRLAAAAVLFLGILGAGIAVYRIQTDKGELAITSESDDVEVVIKQSGKLVRIVDAKTDKAIALTLRSGTYELELKGDPEGLKLDLDSVSLRRGETRLAKIERVLPPTADWEKVREVRRFVGHGEGIQPVAFSPDGRQILTGAHGPANMYADCDIQLWDVSTGKEVGRLKGQRSRILAAAFSADGKRVVAGSAWPDWVIRVWDVGSGKVVGRFEHNSLLEGRNMGSVYGVAFTADGGHVLSCGDDRTVRMWEVETGNEVRRFKGLRSIVRCLAVSRDGRFLACGGCQNDGSILVWEVETGKEVRRFEGHTWTGEAGETGVAFSPDGKRILSGGYDGTVRLWDIPSGEEVRRFTGHTDFVFGVAFSPDGRRILSASYDRSVRLWDAGTGKELHRFTGHPDRVKSVSISPDGRFAVSGGDDNTARLWRLPDPPAARDQP